MIKIFSTILFGAIISLNMNANTNINEKEVKSYSILKYKADFDKQDTKLQLSITDEYLRVKK